MCIAVAYTDIVNQKEVIKIGRTVWQVVNSMSISDAERAAACLLHI